MENTNTVNKPLSLILAESREAIIKAINSTGLPMTLLEPIIKDLYNEINIQASRELEFEKAEYEKALADAKANESKGSTEK